MNSAFLTRARKSRLIRNSGWNMIGQGVPMLVGLVSIPILIRTIGDSRFGFLSIAWILIGYFGVLDLGIGRALTHAVSKRLAHDSAADISDLAWTGVGMLGLLGTIAGLLIAAFSPWLVNSFISIGDDLKPEALRALIILSAAVPFVLMSAGLRGILEARQNFRVLNLVQMPLGILLYAGPLFVIRFSVSLQYVILPLFIVRVSSCLVFFAVCARGVDSIFKARFSRTTLRELLSFGGWMTVTNVVSPLMVNMDRLFIGSRFPVAAVTYYSTPFEVVSKMLMVPSSIASASFPEFSRLEQLEAREAARRHVLRAVTIVLALLVPPALIAGVFAHGLLAWWVSPALADQSATIMRILSLGIVINGVSYVPFAYVQGTGRSDLTAKFHLLELALYVPTLIAMISWLGLVGVAIAWVLRVLLDACLLFGYTWTRLFREPARPDASPVLAHTP